MLVSTAVRPKLTDWNQYLSLFYLDMEIKCRADNLDMCMRRNAEKAVRDVDRLALLDARNDRRRFDANRFAKSQQHFHSRRLLVDLRG